VPFILAQPGPGPEGQQPGEGVPPPAEVPPAG
jgi:hypothetical protein